MANLSGRIRRLELRLNPKGGALRALKQTLACGSAVAYAKMLARQPSAKSPWSCAAKDVTEAVRNSMGPAGPESVNAACHQACRDIQFLGCLFSEVNELVTSRTREGRLWLKFVLGDLHKYTQVLEVSLRVLRFLSDDTPYPLDATTAAAVEEAHAREILPWVFVTGWAIFWVRQHFAERGKSVLPIAYRRYGGAHGTEGSRAALTVLDTQFINELQGLFRADAALDDFLAGRDFRFGLADVRDVEFERTVDTVLKALSQLSETGVLESGSCLHFPTVPMPFLKDAPLVEGKWVDQAIIALAEWGGLLTEKGFTVEESDDDHPLCMAQIYSPQTDAGASGEASYDQIAPLFAQARANLAKFKGKKRTIANRIHINLEDYVSWKGRKVKGSLTAKIGLLARSWNSWIEAQGGLGKVALAGVKVSRIETAAGRARYAMIGSPGEAFSAQQRRKQMVRTLWSRIIIPKAVCQTHARRRTASEPRGENSTFDPFRWRTDLLMYAGDLLLFQRAIERIKQEYFNGHEILFKDGAENLESQMLALEGLAAAYNASGCSLDRWEEPRTAKDIAGQDDLDDVFASEGPIDLEELQRLIDPLVSKRVEDIVDRAKAAAHRSFGEEKEARVLVAKDHAEAYPFAKYGDQVK